MRSFAILFFLISIVVLESASIKDAKKAYSQRQFKKAVKLFNEYSHEHPSDGEPLMYLGYIHEAEKDFPLSISYFRKAVELNLDKKHKKTCYLKIALFYKYHQGWDVVVHYTNRFLKLDPKNKEVQKLHDLATVHKGHDNGGSYVSLPQPEKEKEEKVSKKKSKEPEEKDSTRNEEDDLEETYWERSLKYFKEEDYEKADKLMQWLISRNPNNKEYLYKAGIAKLRLGNYEEAIKLFRSARKNTEKKNKKFLYYVYLNEAQANQKLQKTSRSLELYRTALLYQPDSLAAALSIARVYYEKEKYPLALKYSEKSLKIEEDNLEALLYHSISLINSKKRFEGYKELLSFMKKYKETNPTLTQIPEKFLDAPLYLGFFYSGRTKYKLSLKYLSIVEKYRANHPRYLFAYGKSNYYLNNYKQAEEALLRLSKIPASDYLLSKLYARQNNPDKAKEYLAKSAQAKDIYWIKLKLDAAFSDLLKTKDFYDFVENKGKPGEKELAVKNENSPKEELKIETREAKPNETQPVEVPPQNNE